MTDDPSRGSDYRIARIGVAGALTLCFIVLLFIDAASTEYEISATVLGVLPTMIIILLGIEAASFIRGSKP